MPASSFTRYRIESFPSEEELTTHFQRGLPFAKGPHDDAIHSGIRLLGDSEDSGFLKYYIRHEIWTSRLVRFQQQEYPKVIEIIELHAFQRREEPFFYFRGREKHCTDFIKRLGKTCPEIEAYGRKVDLTAIRNGLPDQIRGGWFKELQVADVRTAAIFGQSVAQSEDWKRYQGLGNITNLTVELDLSVGPFSLQIGQKGTIVLYGKMTERLALELLMQIDEFVGRYVIAEIPIVSRKKID